MDEQKTISSSADDKLKAAQAKYQELIALTSEEHQTQAKEEQDKSKSEKDE